MNQPTETTIRIYRGNDVTLAFSVTDATTNLPLDLTGCTASFVRKASRFVSDSDASAKTYTGTITDALNGRVSVLLPASDNGTPGIVWWRFDISSSSSTRTALIGPLDVFAV